MGDDVTNWVAEKLSTKEQLDIIGRTAKGFLIVKLPSSQYTFNVAVLSVQKVIGLSDVEPLFAGADKPQLVINVPSSPMWDGAAIEHVHAEGAAFGTFGDVSRAAYTEDAGSYRNKDMNFFVNMLKQHSNVTNVSYVYETVFKADRKIGPSLTVAVINAYNMSAEDVRNAKARVGHFDIVVKSTSFGSITNQAEAAAKSMGAQALSYSELMQRLAK